MQLLFRRLDSEQLVHTLDDQGVWALLQSSSTFLQGVGLLARWAPGLPPGCGGTGRGSSLPEGLGRFWGIARSTLIQTQMADT